MGHIPIVPFAFSKGHVNLVTIQIFHGKILSSDLDNMIAQKARL